MTFSLFSRAQRSTTETDRLASEAQRQAGEFVDGPVELTTAELRLVAGGEDTAPKGGWIVPASTTSSGA